MMDIFSSMCNVINIITNNSFFGKLMTIGGALTASFFTPIVGLIFACFALNIADLITGIRASRKLGNAITSRKNWKGTITKILQESQLLVLLHIIEHFVFSAVGVETTLLTGGASILICLTEVWSLLENLNTINPDGPWKILKDLLVKKGEDITGIEIDFDKNGKVSNIKPLDVKESAELDN